MSPGRTIAPPVVGPVLQEFIDAHRSQPWPDRQDHGDARAGDLYKLYVEVGEKAGLQSSGVRRLGDPEEPLLSSRDFGLALQGAGFGGERDAAGRNYWMLDLQTREERARSGATRSATQTLWDDLWDAATLRHVGTFDHGTHREARVWQDRDGLTHDFLDGDDQPMFDDVPNDCTCDPNALADKAAPSVNRAIAAYVAEKTADGTIDRLIEHWYGPFLRWHEGDDTEVDAWYVEQDRSIRRRGLSDLRDVEFKLARARADRNGYTDSYNIRPLKTRRDVLREELGLPLWYMPGHVAKVYPPGTEDWDRDWETYVDGGPDRTGEVNEVPAD